MEEAKTYEVRRGRTEIEVPGRDGNIIFVHPSQGPHNYPTVGKGILARGLTLPIAEQTAYLLHAAYCGPEDFKEREEITKIRDLIMKNRWLWSFDQNLWTSKGVYVVSDPEAIGVSQPLDQEDLERKLSESPAGSPILYSSDGTIRFAPKGSYSIGEHTKESLAKDGFVVASFGQEGAERLAEVSEEFKDPPKTWGLDIQEGKSPVQRVTALDGYYGGLCVGGDCRVDDWGGHAFGV